jgi:hypothetical protein
MEIPRRTDERAPDPAASIGEQLHDDGYGPWEPFRVDEVEAAMAGFGGPWWFTGGHALELFAGFSWRRHDDIDVGILRRDVPLLAPLAGSLEVFVAAGGVLTPWSGGPLSAERDENNIWMRRPHGTWCLDVAIGEGDDDRWIYRRDPSLRLPWDQAVRSAAGGRRYLAPELQLLFKSKTIRAKDDVDAAVVIPLLGDAAADLLRARLPTDHPWQRLLVAP